MCAEGPGPLLLEKASHLGYPSLMLLPDPTTLQTILPTSPPGNSISAPLVPASVLPAALASNPGPRFYRRRTSEHPGQGKHSALRLGHRGAEHRVWPCQKYLDVPKPVGLLQGCLGEGRLHQTLGPSDILQRLLPTQPPMRTAHHFLLTWGTQETAACVTQGTCWDANTRP